VSRRPLMVLNGCVRAWLTACGKPSRPRTNRLAALPLDPAFCDRFRPVRPVPPWQRKFPRRNTPASFKERPAGLRAGADTTARPGRFHMFSLGPDEGRRTDPPRRTPVELTSRLAFEGSIDPKIAGSRGTTARIFRGAHRPLCAEARGGRWWGSITEALVNRRTSSRVELDRAGTYVSERTNRTRRPAT